MNYDQNSFLAGLAVGRQLKGWAGGLPHTLPAGFCYAVQPEDIVGGLWVEYSVGATATYGQNLHEIHDGDTVSLDSGSHWVTYSMRGGLLVADTTIYAPNVHCAIGMTAGAGPGNDNVLLPLPGVYKEYGVGVVEPQGSDPTRFTVRTNSRTVTVADAAVPGKITLWHSDWVIYSGTWHMTQLFLLPTLHYTPA